jgi:hypothetical protein
MQRTIGVNPECAKFLLLDLRFECALGFLNPRPPQVRC